MATVSISCIKCGNDLWECFSGIAECTNCLYERPYIPRKNHSGKITPSQQRRMDQLKEYFINNWLFGETKLHKFEIHFQDETGFVYVSLETSSHPLTEDGGHFMIGRKGKLTVMLVYGLGQNKKKTAKHYAFMLGGKVSKCL